MGIYISGQSEAGSNGNEGVFLIPKNSRTVSASSNAV